jgi:tyrosine-protein phosphatase cpsB
MQINSSSVLKPRLFGDTYKFMKKRARYFLDKDLVHVVASDMHNLESRPPYMREAYELIAKKYGAEKARELFETNPSRIINDQLI